MFELYGIKREAFPNCFDAWLNGLHPEDRGAAIAASQAALNGEQEYNTVFRVLHPDGAVKHIKANAIVTRGADGTPERMIGINYDITERIRLAEERQELENQLIFAQKMESLGVLAGGIAHDFNNILAIIMGNCSLAKMDSENAENYIPEIEKASDRAAALCRQMLAYAGKAQIVQSRFDFAGLVDEMVKMLRSSLPQNTVIKLSSLADIPPVSGDASQIRQVVMNLIINASEAIGESQGEIKVSLTKTTIKDGKQARDHQGKAISPGWYVCLEVTDNGCGMDNETRQRIFEPFYTTKFTGRGLGMSAVLGIIMSHGGALQLYSHLGQGTAFKVYLPIQISESVGDEGTPHVPLTPWQGSGTILLVEDEEQVRLIAQALLIKLGFTVIEATNGREALELYQKNAAEITLVVTDVGMPVMNGYELFRELKKLRPELPIIISSGFGDVDVSSKISRDDIAGLIGKPYSFDQLREVLKKVVEGMPIRTV
jgi:signal transduction histidine kinase/ActR/RegA family two-component response regulator